MDGGWHTFWWLHICYTSQGQVTCSVVVNVQFRNSGNGSTKCWWNTLLATLWLDKPYRAVQVPALGILTYDKIPGRGEDQGAGECDSIQGEAGWSGPLAAVVEQPNEATAQAEVDRPAVRNNTIMALKGRGDDINGSLKRQDLSTVVQYSSVTHIEAFMWPCIYIYIQIHIQIHTNVYVFVYVYKYIYKYTNTHTYIHKYMYIAGKNIIIKLKGDEPSPKFLQA